MRADEPTVHRLVQRVRACLTDDLRRKPWKGSKNPMAGHCYVASEVLQQLLGFQRFKAMNVKHEGSQHWFLVDRITGEVVDPTADQFETPVPYHLARGRGLQTDPKKPPSKRAQVVMERMRQEGSRR